MIYHLYQLQEHRAKLVMANGKHLTHIEDQLERVSALRHPAFLEDHSDLEDEITSFEMELRKAKKEVFTVTEHVIMHHKFYNIASTKILL